jgi:hypothetical protein
MEKILLLLDQQSQDQQFIRPTITRPTVQKTDKSQDRQITRPTITRQTITRPTDHLQQNVNTVEFSFKNSYSTIFSKQYLI